MGVKIEGKANVMVAINGRSLKGKKKLTVNVGYKADYAVHVHEDLEMPHKTGQAKFLEQPIRQMQGQMRRTLTTALRNHEGLETALKRAGNQLLKESKKLVPVDTGYLRDSGFVEVA